MAGTKGFTCTLKVGLESAASTVGKAQNVKINSSAGIIDVSSRDSPSGFKEHLQGLKSWGSNVDQLWVPTDAGLQALRDAFLSGDELFAEFADADGYGFKGKVLVTGMDMDQPLEGGVTLPITLTGTGALETLSPA